MPDDVTTKNPTEWLKQRYLDIEFEIEERAKTDGQFAIAHALLRLTAVLDDRLEDMSDRLEALAPRRPTPSPPPSMTWPARRTPTPWSKSRPNPLPPSP